MKKLISLLLAFVMVLSLATVAFATESSTPETPATPVPTVGSITINGVSNDTTYEIYKLMDLESFSKGAAYSYKVNPVWNNFFTEGPGKDYITIDPTSKYITWSAGESDTIMAAFAQAALEYAQTNNIDPVKSSENNGEFVITGTSGKFSDLELGWYLVDSTAGALCGLTTTDADAVINAKNKVPTIDKQVQEDLTGMWGDVNTADIGQIVNFMTIIHVQAGAENYVLHDSMSKGLTFEHKTANGRGVTEIKHVTSAGVETTLNEGTDYTVNTTCGVAGHTCDFTVKFTDTFVKTLKPNDRIIVYYNAMLNRYAEAGTTGNSNESSLEYGEDHFTTNDKTETYTFSIDIIKTDSSNQLIDGAKFRIYDAATEGNEVAVVPLMEADDITPILDEDGNPMYRRARADETGVDIVVKDGKVTVIGFDNGVYYLQETEAPAGYNKLTARQSFTVADSNLDSVFTGDTYSTGSGVHVVNKTGSMLPETGATGTAMFIFFGMFVMLTTGVLLVTKKRMSMIEE